MTTEVEQLLTTDYRYLLGGDEVLKQRFELLMNSVVSLTQIIEGSGIPAFQADKHSQYFDTATSKYYRNTDGGTTWVALN